MLSRVLRSAIQATDFDIDGMHGKQRRNHGAAPCVAGRSLQHPEQQHHVKHMEQQVDFMVPGRHRGQTLQSSACESHVTGCQFSE